MMCEVQIVRPPAKPVRRFFQRCFPAAFERLQVAGWRLRDRRDRRLQSDLFERLMAAVDGPTHIEIETFNRCNSTCSFCPVNRDDDLRAAARMPDSLFTRIIDELAERSYEHKLCLHSNNEPFLDKRIYEFAACAREKLPRAFLQIYTNGTTLDPDKTERILPHLSSLVINNYSTELKLHDNVKAIVSYLNSKQPDLAGKVVVRLRLLDEFKTNRSGRAPNRRVLEPVYRSRCAFPYFQLVIRPDGKVSLCCYDALGEKTLGDVSTQGVWGAWESQKRTSVQLEMLKGRDKIDKCRHCDNLGWSKPSRIAEALESSNLTSTYRVI